MQNIIIFVVLALLIKNIQNDLDFNYVCTNFSVRLGVKLEAKKVQTTYNLEHREYFSVLQKYKSKQKKCKTIPIPFEMSLELAECLLHTPYYQFNWQNVPSPRCTS